MMSILATIGASHHCKQLDFTCPSLIEDANVRLFRECLEGNRKLVFFMRIILESLKDGGGLNLDVYAMVSETLKEP